MQPPLHPAPRAQTTPNAGKETAVFKHHPPARQPKSSFEVADNPFPPNFKYPRYTPHPHRPAALSREAATRRRGAGARGRSPPSVLLVLFCLTTEKNSPVSRPQAAFSRRPQATKSPANKRLERKQSAGRRTNKKRAPVARRRRNPREDLTLKKDGSRTAHKEKSYPPPRRPARQKASRPYGRLALLPPDFQSSRTVMLKLSNS